MTKSKLPDPAKLEQEKRDLIEVLRKMGINKPEECVFIQRDGLYFHLYHKNIGDAGASTLAEALKVNSSVTNIGLSKIPEAILLIFVEALRGININTISIYDCNISDVTAATLIESLKINTNIKEFQFSRNNFSDKGVVVLAEMLRVNSTLTRVNLSQNLISDVGVAALAEALKVNSAVTNIELIFQQISDAGATALAEMLKVNSTITTINLGHNQIGDVGAMALAEALKVNSTVTNIDVNSNKIGDKGVVAFAEMLRVNSTITRVHLGQNLISDVGAEAFAEALKVNTNITNIGFNENRISDAGVTFLAEALKVNTSVSYIWFVGNDIGEKGLTALAEMLKETSTIITSICLGNCGIGEKGAAELLEALKVNTNIIGVTLDNYGDYSFKNNISSTTLEQINKQLAYNRNYNNALRQKLKKFIEENFLAKEKEDWSEVSKKKELESDSSLAQFKLYKKFGKDGLKVAGCSDISLENMESYLAYLAKTAPVTTTSGSVVKSGVIAGAIEVTPKYISTETKFYSLDDRPDSSLSSSFSSGSSFGSGSSFHFDSTSSGGSGGTTGSSISSSLKLSDSPGPERLDHKSRSIEPTKTVDSSSTTGSVKFTQTSELPVITTETRLSPRAKDIAKKPTPPDPAKVEQEKQGLIAVLSKLGVYHEYRVVKREDGLHLNFSRCYINDELAAIMAEALKNSSSIKSILIDYCVSITGITVLAEALKVNTSVTSICRHNQISGHKEMAVLIEMLKVNTSINNVSFHLTHIGDAGAIALAEMLKENSTITSIDLHSNKISDAGAIALAEMLKENSSVKYIGLNQNQIGEKGAIALAEALKVNSTVTNIDLYSNQIGDAGAAALAEMLKVNRSITNINFTGNQIGEKGAVALAEAFKVNNSVKEISIWYNKIGDVGAVALAEMLKINSTITNIDLHSNKISDAGAIALAEMLKENSSVKYVGLNQNQIGDAGASALAEMLKVNSSVRLINLGSCGIGEKGAVALLEALKVNSTVTNIPLDSFYYNNPTPNNISLSTLEQINKQLEHNRAHNDGLVQKLKKFIEENFSTKEKEDWSEVSKKKELESDSALAQIKFYKKFGKDALKSAGCSDISLENMESYLAYLAKTAPVTTTSGSVVKSGLIAGAIEVTPKYISPETKFYSLDDRSDSSLSSSSGSSFRFDSTSSSGSGGTTGSSISSSLKLSDSSGPERLDHKSRSIEPTKTADSSSTTDSVKFTQTSELPVITTETRLIPKAKDIVKKDVDSTIGGSSGITLLSQPIKASNSRIVKYLKAKYFIGEDGNITVIDDHESTPLPKTVMPETHSTETHTAEIVPEDVGLSGLN